MRPGEGINMAQAPRLQAEMFGGLEIRVGDHILVEKGGRVNKPIELLVYLLLNIGEKTTNDQLMEVLWEEDEVENPAGALKNAVYSVRRMLAKAGIKEDCIITRDRQYTWNPDVPVDIDVDRFNELYRRCVTSDAPVREIIEACRAGIALYAGDFLPSLSDRYWLMTRAGALRQRYQTMVLHLSDLLLAEDERSGAEEVLNLCARALLLEPLSEELYLRYFNALRRLDMKAAVLSYYPVVANMFLDEVGEPLPAEVRDIYRWAAEGANLPMEDIRHIQKDLDEVTRDDRPIRGAYFCPYEVFKHMYHMVVRNATRNEEGVILLLVTLVPLEAPKQEMIRVMLGVRELIKNMLRKGDVFARYSRNQYVLMLSVKSTDDFAVVRDRLLARYQESGMSTVLRMEVTVGIPDPIV